MENQLINVLIIGWGTSANVFHYPLIASLPNSYRITHVLERHSNKSEKVIENVKVIRSLEELYQSQDKVDLAVITTPNSSHYNLAKDLLEHKINVVVEKPFVVNLSEANELCQISKKNEVFITVYHNRRWDGDFLTLKKLIKNNSLGRIVDYESHFDRYRNFLKNNWKEREEPGAGIVYDLGSHLIDQALCLFGDPTSVYARIMNQRKIEGCLVPDAFEIHLNYDKDNNGDYSSLLVNLKASMLIKENQRLRFNVHGTHGSYIKYGLDIQEDQLRAGQMPSKNADVFGIEKGSESWGSLSAVSTTDTTQEINEKVQTENGNYLEFYKNIAEGKKIKKKK